MRKLIAILVLTLILNGCAISRPIQETARTVGTIVKTTGTIVETTGKVVIVGVKAVAETAKAGGEVVKTVVTTPGLKEVVLKKLP